MGVMGAVGHSRVAAKVLPALWVQSNSVCVAGEDTDHYPQSRESQRALYLVSEGREHRDTGEGKGTTFTHRKGTEDSAVLPGHLPAHPGLAQVSLGTIM